MSKNIKSRCINCSASSFLVESEQNKELCQYCNLQKKIEQEIGNIKDHAENESISNQLGELETMRKALSMKIKDRSSISDSKAGVKEENENTDSSWEDDNSLLPVGWKIKVESSKTNCKIRSSDSKYFDNYLSVFVHMSRNRDTYAEKDIVKVKDSLVNEGWKDSEKLPAGWKVSDQINDNLFVILSREGYLFQSLDAAQDFLKESEEYDEEDVLNLEDLCMSFVAEYTRQLNIEPEPPSDIILRRGSNFPCEQCGQCFRKKSKLDAHASFHKGLKPYQCKQCMKAFSLEENLKQHMVNHKKEVVKLYTCQVCAKPFYYLSKITKHMEEMHPDVFPYRCTLCGQNFSRSEILRIHKKNHIKSVKVPSCNVCGKSFRTNYNLKRHKEMFH